jgi:hypothetical protein
MPPQVWQPKKKNDKIVPAYTTAENILQSQNRNKMTSATRGILALTTGEKLAGRIKKP